MVKDCWVFSFFVKFLNLGSQLILYIWSYSHFGFCFVQYSFMIFSEVDFLVFFVFDILGLYDFFWVVFFYVLDEEDSRSKFMCFLFLIMFFLKKLIN